MSPIGKNSPAGSIVIPFCGKLDILYVTKDFMFYFWFLPQEGINTTSDIQVAKALMEFEDGWQLLSNRARPKQVRLGRQDCIESLWNRANAHQVLCSKALPLKQ